MCIPQKARLFLAGTATSNSRVTYVWLGQKLVRESHSLDWCLQSKVLRESFLLRASFVCKYMKQKRWEKNQWGLLKKRSKSWHSYWECLFSVTRPQNIKSNFGCGSCRTIFCNLMGQISGWLLNKRRKRKVIYLVNRVDELFWIKTHDI